ncbi:hypothetical protein GCM10023331_13350 [Algivirga pacifica]|uniref:Tc1-like transposase DDE domain-containing protein n=1 Tax=Algivirga pacifica TaxID=1162670 RepID=A0ABP9D601_9BACT
MSKLLDRFGIHYKRARYYLHSRDLEYEAKLKSIQVNLAQYHPERRLIFFQDEHTVTNIAPLHCEYEQNGEYQRRVELPYTKQKQFRINAAINAFTGQFFSMVSSKVSVPRYIAFLQNLVEQNPNREIYLVQDNWPIHFHPDVLAALVPQKYQERIILPKSWSRIIPKKKYEKMCDLPIQLVLLPTYSPWLNPIEKCWKWLNQAIVNNNHFANDFISFKYKVQEVLDSLNRKNSEMLSYIGLTKERGIYSWPIALAKSYIYDG